MDRSVKEFGYDYLDINTLDFITIDYPPGTTVAPGDAIKADIYTRHFSHKTINGTTLHWQLDTMSATGHVTRGIVDGRVEIPISAVSGATRTSTRTTDPRCSPPRSATLHVWVTDHTGTVVARNFINFEHFTEAPVGGVSNPEFRTDSGAMRLNYTPGNTSESSWNEPTTDAQLFSAIGSGYVEYEISLPEGLDAGDISEMALVFEASSCYGGARQTGAREISVGCNDLSQRR